MFFEAWYQGILFGIMTTLGMLAVVFALMTMWKKYEDQPFNAGGTKHQPQ